jgi:hypothetical protein
LSKTQHLQLPAKFELDSLFLSDVASASENMIIGNGEKEENSAGDIASCRMFRRSADVVFLAIKQKFKQKWLYLSIIFKLLL